MTRPTRETEGGTGVRERVETPRRYRVLLLNDDYTSMEFVVMVLVEVFRHTQVAATRIMLNVHRTGSGVAGVYTRDVAETRVDQVHQLAREAGYPLQAVAEPEDSGGD